MQPLRRRRRFPALEAVALTLGASVVLLSLSIGFWRSAGEVPLLVFGAPAAAVLAAAVLAARLWVAGHESDLERLRAELERLRAEFLATTSKELRAPLARIAGHSATLVDHWPELEDGARRDLAMRIASNAEELNRTVVELIDLSRLEAESTNPEAEAFDVGSEMQRTIEGLRTLLPSHRIQLHAPAGIKAFADPSVLRRVVAALVHNAARFSLEDSLIIARARESNGDVVVSVDDHGIGVPPSETERIFEPFYRAERDAGGFGIGLAVARRLVEAQGGRIWVEPAEGRGSTFIFTLPAAAQVRT